MLMRMREGGRGEEGEGRGLKAVESWNVCSTYLFVSFSIAIASEEGKSPGLLCIFNSMDIKLGNL